MTDTVPFTEETVKKYLDDAIRHWRTTKASVPKDMQDGDLIAQCYIDAYQSVRMSLFGELLK